MPDKHFLSELYKFSLTVPLTHIEAAKAAIGLVVSRGRMIKAFAEKKCRFCRTLVDGRAKRKALRFVGVLCVLRDFPAGDPLWLAKPLVAGWSARCSRSFTGTVCQLYG